mgnify:CR=1 FL=1
MSGLYGCHLTVIDLVVERLHDPFGNEKAAPAIHVVLYEVYRTDIGTVLCTWVSRDVTDGVLFTGTDAGYVTTVADGICLAVLGTMCSFFHMLSSLPAMRLYPY